MDKNTDNISFEEAQESLVETLRESADQYLAISKRYQESIQRETKMLQALTMLSNQRKTQFKTVEDAKFFVDRFIEQVCSL
jgi:t-SNARE complex subunit (syntaxin)